MKKEIINLSFNVTKDELKEFLEKELSLKCNLELKKFNASSEYERLADNEKEAGEELIKKIIAFGKDESYLEVVPVMVCKTSDLEAPVQDPNLMFIGDVKTVNVSKLNSRYVVKHIIEKTNGTSEVYLNTPLVVLETALTAIDGLITRDEVISRKPLYDIAISYNGECYTIAFTNRYYKEV